MLDKAFGGRWNPGFQSGVLAVFFLAVALLSGVGLLFFYRVASPYASVEGLQSVTALSWLRSLHRISSDAAVLAVIAHLLKMLTQARCFGARARAWVSGLVLTLVTLVVGVTGLVMVWDSLGQRLALSVVRMVALLPLFSEPPQRVVSEPANLGPPFFFMLMFLHVALPLAMAGLLWFHTSRLARPIFWPETALVRFWLPLLFAIAFIPAPLGEAADPHRLPGPGHLDLFYAFWLPAEEQLGPAATALALMVITAGLALYPLRRSREQAPPPSKVDESLCDGCTQCFQDCPYDAIEMIARTSPDERRSPLVARVEPDLCVSCGICAASCKPMGVGPQGRTGRDQLKAMEALIQEKPIAPGQVIVLACASGCGTSQAFRGTVGVVLVPTPCSGALHTSVIELFLRRGALGVMVCSCPARDCANREGPKWLEQRVHHDREAELMARVDRRRVLLSQGSRAQAAGIAAEARAFLERLRSMGAPDLLVEEEALCEHV